VSRLQNVRTLDLTEAFVAAARERGMDFSPGHYKAAGNELTAQQIKKLLMEADAGR